jgi:hypothetical protein
VDKESSPRSKGEHGEMEDIDIWGEIHHNPTSEGGQLLKVIKL